MNGGILFMKEKKNYAKEIKLKAIEMKSAGVAVKKITEKFKYKKQKPSIHLVVLV